MSEMVERVTRAMVRDLISPSRHGERVVDEVMKTPIAEKARRQARAAIQAMREPTEAMVEAGRNEVRLLDRRFDTGKHAAVDTWQAMIDGALK